jgi:hypothetical protein
MAEFLSNYGVWVLLGGIFVAMHVFGVGCCGGHSHRLGTRRTEEAADDPKPAAAGAVLRRSEPGGSRRVNGCH